MLCADCAARGLGRKLGTPLTGVDFIIHFLCSPHEFFWCGRIHSCEGSGARGPRDPFFSHLSFVSLAMSCSRFLALRLRVGSLVCG